MAVRLCQKQPVFRKWIVRAVSVWLIPIQKRSTNLNIIWYITQDEMISVTMHREYHWFIEAWQWLWRKRNEVGVIIALCPYLEWAGWNLQAHTLTFFSLGHNIDHWSGALYQQSTYLLFQQNTDWTHFSFLSLVIKETMVILNEKNKMLLWFLL